MRIVVTGATGNVGTALLRRLGDEGHELVGLARRVPRAGTTPGRPVSWVSVDLTEPAGESVLAQAVRGADAVVHLAWGFQPSHDLAHLAELGIGGTRRVLTAVRAADVPHLVHLSSVGAYSPRSDERPVDESYPTGGIPGSPYSRHKAAAERLLDDAEERGGSTTVTRMRPGIVGQRQAGSALLRYGLPAAVPAGMLRHVPVLPVDRALSIPVVHADDVADAVARAIAGRVGGAFNLAADPPVTAQDVAAVLGARLVHVPRRVVRAAVDASWRARVQPLDPGWIDLAYEVPLISSDRAARELGWAPAHDGRSVLAELVAGMAGAEHAATPVLRPRTVLGGLRRAVLAGPVAHRRRP